MVARKITSRRIQGTNISVQADQTRTTNDTVNRWLAVQTYDPETAAASRGGDRVNNFLQSLRPQKKLIDPTEAFVQATKTLRPAVRFNTYDKEIARRNRQGRREKHATATARRREQRMTPNPALRSALNPKKLPPAALEMQQQTEHDDTLLDESRTSRDEASRKMGLRVKKLGKAKNRKDFRDPRERKTMVGDEL